MTKFFYCFTNCLGLAVLSLCYKIAWTFLTIYCFLLTILHEFFVFGLNLCTTVRFLFERNFLRLITFTTTWSWLEFRVKEFSNIIILFQDSIAEVIVSKAISSKLLRSLVKSKTSSWFSTFILTEKVAWYLILLIWATLFSEFFLIFWIFSIVWKFWFFSSNTSTTWNLSYFKTGQFRLNILIAWKFFAEVFWCKVLRLSFFFVSI